MTESIGTARLDIVVDTSQFDSAIAAAKSRVSGMSQAAQAEYEKLNAAEKRRVNSLITQADLIGKTRQEQILYNAALKGAPTAVLDDLKRRLAGVKQETEAGTISAKQYNAALRGVPAQLTDIFTGLASGQNPMTVLIQQGGQLKDMFGGVGTAASALGSSLLQIINPITLLGAAVAGMAVLWHDAEQEQENFARALVTTGNFAGTTAAQLDLIAGNLAKSGEAFSDAAGIVAKVASTGEFTASQIKAVSEAAIAAQRDLGVSVDETIAKFVGLANDPVDAILALNEKEHFLTQAVLDQIVALDKQGDHMGAAEVAIRSLAQTTGERAAQMAGDVDHLEKAWKSLKSTIAGVWDDIRGSFRTGPSQQIRELEGNLKALRDGSGIYAQVPEATRERLARDMEARIKTIREVAGRAAAAAARGPVVDSAAARKQLQERDDAERRWAAEVQRNLSKREALEARIAQIRADGVKLGKKESEVEAQIAAERKRFADAEAKRQPKARKATDPTESIVERLKQQIALSDAQAASEDRLTAAERQRITVMAELDRLGAKVTPARRQEIVTLLDQAEASEKAAARAKDEAKAKEELVRLTNALTVAERNRAQANADAVAAVGLGQRQVEMMRRRLDIEREYEKGVQQLRDKGIAEGSESYRAQEAALREARDRMLAGEEGFWRSMDAARANWQNGARRALQDYVDAAKDIAGQTNEIVGNTLGGLEDAFTELITKGKADWKGFFDSIAADFTRMIVRQQLAKLAQAVLPKLGLGGGGDGGEAAALSASAVQLTASGGTLITAATMLSASASALAAAGVSSGQGAGGSSNWLSAIFGAFTANANGGVYTSPSLSAYSGQIVDKPTVFAFAKGAGLMGEAGPEAIVPLKRGPDGKLGVRMERDAAAGAVTVNQTWVVQGNPDRRTRDQMARDSGREAARAMSRTGR